MGRQPKCALSRIDADQVRAAISQLILYRGLNRNVAHDVMPVDPIHNAGLQRALGKALHEFVVEYDVNVPGQYEPAPCSPYTDVLGSHLVERQGVRGCISRVSAG